MENIKLSDEKEIEYASNLLNTAIREFNKKNYSMSSNLLNEAKTSFKNTKLDNLMSLCLSLEGALDYIEDKKNYNESLNLLEDA